MVKVRVRVHDDVDLVKSNVAMKFGEFSSAVLREIIGGQDQNE